MNHVLADSATRATVLVVDVLALRRVGIVSLLRLWAEDGDVDIVQDDPAGALAQSDPSAIKLILLVLGPQSVTDAGPQNWIPSLKVKYPGTPLVLVSEREQPEEVVAAFEAGACGFVPMSIAPPVAVEAFKFIMGGGSFFPPTALVQRVAIESVAVAHAMDIAIVDDDRRCGLTARQQQVLDRLRRGESNKLIARQLQLRESTVKVHIRQIMRKLGATNRTQAALSAGQWLAVPDESDG